MNKMAKKRRPRFLIPLLYQQKNQNIIQIAKLFSKIDAVQVIGIVTLPENKELSEGVNDVRALRSFLAENINESESNIHTEVQVTHDTWNLIKETVEKTYPKVHTLILEWPHQIAEMAIDLKEVLNNQFCNIAITRGQFKDPYENILIPIRGGPRSIEALRMSLKLSEFFNAQITIERIFNSEAQRIEIDDDFLAIQRVLDEIPGIKQKNTISKNVSQAILESACQNDIVLLGAGTPENNEPSLFGTITSKILDGCEADVIAIKTRVRAEPHTPLFTSQAISVLVDKWFAENTFDAEEFKNIEQLVDKKESKGLTISLALPALNEEETVGNVIQIAKTEFMERYPLIDEIILVDSGSTDRTRDIAKKMGIPVYLNQEVLSNYGFRNGKGEVLWKSLYLTNGDIVFWVDTDIHNFNPKFIYGVLGPMIMDDRIKFVKGFYKRPIMGKNGIVHPGGGGRVTELTARPMLNLFYPQLSGIIQPLSGEYGGKREALEKLTFTSGYGVETSLLIDMLNMFKLHSIGQTNLDVRVHRNQPLQNLGKMSFAIIQTVLSKLEKRYGVKFIQDINKTMNIIQYDEAQFYLDVHEIIEQERQPMIEIEEYRQKFGVR
jgi:glycosyltransferase involved in cell wall biosynthesis